MKSDSSVTKKTRTSSTETKTKKVTASKAAPTRTAVKRIVRKPRSTVVSRVKKHSKVALKSILLSRSFQTSLKATALCLVVGSSLYGVYHLVSKTFANEVVISKSEIVSRVSKLTPLPEAPPYDVVRVEDENSLKKQNDFYKDVKEGDYIVMYKDTAIVYDLRNNSIVAMRKTLSDTNDGNTAKSAVEGATSSAETAAPRTQ